MNPDRLADAAVAWYMSIDALESLRLTSIIATYVKQMEQDCPELKAVPVTYLLTLLCYGAVLGRVLDTAQSPEVAEEKVTEIPPEFLTGLADVDLEV